MDWSEGYSEEPKSDIFYGGMVMAAISGETQAIARFPLDILSIIRPK
jgi:hypothetical protein